MRTYCDTSKEQYFKIADQGNMAAVLHIPLQSAGPSPVIVFCPGKNGERSEVHRLAVGFARILANAGFAMLRFDYYGSGLSDGWFYEMTPLTRVSNVKAIIKFVREHPAIDGNQVVLLGFSDGARVVMGAVSEMNIKKVILWSPVFFEPPGMLDNTKKLKFTRCPHDPNVLVTPWAGLWLGINFYKDLRNMAIDQLLVSYNGESLIVYDDDDLLVEAERELLQQIDCCLFKESSRNQVAIIPQGGHLFCSIEKATELLNVTLSWLEEKYPG